MSLQGETLDKKRGSLTPWDDEVVCEKKFTGRMLMRLRQGMLLGAIYALTMSQMPPGLSIVLNSNAGSDSQSPKRKGGGGNRISMRASQKRKQKLRAKNAIKNKNRVSKNRR